MREADVKKSGDAQSCKAGVATKDASVSMSNKKDAGPINQFICPDQQCHKYRMGKTRIA